MGSRDRQHGGVSFSYQILFKPQTARNHDFAVFGERLANGAERLLDGGVNEAAGVDDDEVGAGIIGRSDVTLGSQLGEDAFRIYKCLGTAEGNKPNLRAFYRNRLAEGIPGTGSR